jgi:hypothetical protein
VSRAARISLTFTGLALAVGIVVLAVTLIRGPSPKKRSTTVSAASSGGSFELPLAESASALALSKHRGNLLVGMAARPGGPVQVTALRAETPIAIDRLRFALDGRAVQATPCGDGCARLDVAVLDGSPRELSVRGGSSTVSFGLPARLPASGEALFARAQRTMGALRAFRFIETLSSGSAGLVTDFDVQAPNRLRLRTANGFRSVIIGRARWDYHDGRWERGPFPGLRIAQVLIWYRAKHARVVGRRSNGVTELAAFGLEPVPAWFRLVVEPTGRVVEAEMISPSHFMLHRYSDFNGRFVIKPPK